MAATAAAAATSSCRTTTFFPPCPSKAPPPSSLKFPPLSKLQTVYSHRCSAFPQTSPVLVSRIMNPRSVSSPVSAIVDEEESGTPSSSSSSDGDDEISIDSGSVTSLTGCKACGRPEIERGCNGEGRIQGGIATVPGFGWWPIKAYRPCPAYVASGGRYRRTGQSMDEVVSGRGVSGASNGTSGGANSSKRKGKR